MQTATDAKLEAANIVLGVFTDSRIERRKGRHICRRPTGSGWTAYADYRLNDVQPDDATVRDMAAWREWAMSQPKNSEGTDGE